MTHAVEEMRLEALNQVYDFYTAMHCNCDTEQEIASQISFSVLALYTRQLLSVYAFSYSFDSSVLQAEERRMSFISFHLGYRGSIHILERFD